MAEEDCGRMLETALRFRGTLLGVEPPGRRELRVTPVDSEPRLVVSIEVASVSDGLDAGLPLRAGGTFHFGVRELPRRLDLPKAAGRTLDLELRALACDGKFRRWLGLRAFSPDEIERFQGLWPEIGHRYRTRVTFDGELGLRTEVQVRLPAHHEGGLYFENLDDFPRLKRNGARNRIVFEARARHADRVGEWEWMTVYQCRILSLD